VTRTSAVLALCLLAGACSAETARDDAPKRQHERNPASIGFIDIPKDGATVEPTVRVSGWAADESGVKAVRIYFDDELMATVPLVTPRPDVNTTYPKYAKPDAIHGFESLIDAGAHAGYTTIRAEAIDGKGALTQFYTVNVRIRE
jgi:hypothetical protein